MIRISALQKAIGQNTVLNIESLEVEAGEVAGIIGAPGCGKTTLMEILAGRVRPTAGSAFVAGCNVARESAKIWPILGVLFAENALYERQSVRSNLDFQRKLYSMSVQRRDEVLEMIGLSSCADLQTKRLPFSLQRRLALGRAIIHKPKVLLLDEPFGQVDGESVALMSRLIMRLVEEGTTALIFADEPSGLARLCRRIHEMDHGRIISSARADEQQKPQIGLKLPVRQEGKVVFLNPTDVLYAHIEDGQTLIQTSTGEVASNLSLGELEERLRPSGFFRAHRAYLVNLQRVKEIAPYTRDSFVLILDDTVGTVLPLSKASAKQLQDLLGY